MAQAKTTTDHDTIKRWVEERGGCPAHVKSTGSRKDPGVLRIDYTGFSGKQSLEKISWKAFFDAFEQNKLAFLYQDEGESRFSKLVSRKGGASDNGRASHAKNGQRRSSTSRSGAQVDAIELLTQQHREVEDLFDKLESARSESQRGRLFNRLANALAAHTKIEETLFYPTAFSETTEDELRESVEEHLVAKRLISDLLRMKASDPQFMSKANVLREVVMHHVEEEEQQLFKCVREQNQDDLMLLGAKMKKVYTELMKHEPAQGVPKETRSANVMF